MKHRVLTLILIAFLAAAITTATDEINETDDDIVELDQAPVCKIVFSELFLEKVQPGMSKEKIDRLKPTKVHVTYHPETWIARDIEGVRLCVGERLLLSQGQTPEDARKALGPPNDERWHWSKRFGQGYSWFYYDENLELVFYGARSSEEPDTVLHSFELKWPLREPITSDSPIFKGFSYR